MPTHPSNTIPPPTPEDYRHHLAEKQGRLKAEYDQLGGGPVFRGLVPCPDLNGYRSRAKFRRQQRDGKIDYFGKTPTGGFVSRRESLRILPHWAAGSVEGIMDILLLGQERTPVDGFEVRLTHGAPHLHLILYVARGARGPYPALMDHLLAMSATIQGVAIPSQSLESGISVLTHTIAYRCFRSHYTSFFQSNLYLTPRLMDEVQSGLSPVPEGLIVDLYCGVGFHSCHPRFSANLILGVDSQVHAIGQAGENARQAGLNGARFTSGDAGAFVLENPQLHPHTVIINPPRSGVSAEIIENVCAWKPAAIVLITCARDAAGRGLGTWQSGGYSIQRSIALDMFPFTDFVETVTILVPG